MNVCVMLVYTVGIYTFRRNKAGLTPDEPRSIRVTTCYTLGMYIDKTLNTY